jgi:hypothetical protein
MAILGVHTTAPRGRSFAEERTLPHGALGAVTPNAPDAPLAFCTIITSTSSRNAPLVLSRSTHPMYSAASVAGMPTFCATTLWKYVR